MNINVLQEKQHVNFSTDCQIVLHFVDILNLRDYFLSQFPEVFESKYKDTHCLNSSYFHCKDIQGIFAQFDRQPFQMSLNGHIKVELIGT